jgi:hypothetical protein
MPVSAREQRAINAIVRAPGVMIIALDLGRNLGVALGRAGTPRPQSLALPMSRSWDGRADTFLELRRFMEEHLAHLAGRPLFVVKESPPHLKAFLTLRDSSASARTTMGYHATIETSCRLFHVPVFEQGVRTVRLHFIGNAALAREAAKAAVLSRCHELGYLPRDCDDNDRGDALAVFDWASVHIARVAPAELHLFKTGT